VLEVGLISPLNVTGFARVIKSVLRILNCVNVEENLNAVLVAGIHKPFNLFSSTIHAAIVGTVGGGGPVTNGEADDFKLAVSKILNKVLSDPGVPMSAHDGITFLGAECLAESVGVHTNTLSVGVAEEAVEEGGGDPGFEDHPATDVGADDGITLLSNSKGGNGSRSKSLEH